MPLDAYNSAAEEVTTAPETTAPAQNTTTTAASSTAKQTTSAKAAGSPKTGDAGAVLPLSAIALAIGTAFALRRKEV